MIDLSQPLAVGISDAAQLLGMNRKTVSKAIASGEIRATRIGHKTLIAVRHLEELLQLQATV